jgi:hypothetical protein
MWYRSAPVVPAKHPRKIWIPVAALVTYWWLSTAAQAFTAKYIQEISAPGLVYLFYPIGLLSMSILITGVILQISQKKLLSVGVVLLVFTTWFAINQQTINWTLGTQLQSAYTINTELSTALTNSAIEENQRCIRLERWLENPWPDYYREGVVEYLTESYPRLKDQEFCSRIDLITGSETPSQ